MDDDNLSELSPGLQRIVRTNQRNSTEPRFSFAQQVMTGPTSEVLRRRSSAVISALGERSGAAAAASIQASIAMGKLSLDDDEEEKDEDGKPRNPITFGSRRMSPAAMSLLGITDKTSQNLFMKTLGIGNEQAEELIKSRKKPTSLLYGDVTSDECAAVDDPYNLKFDSFFRPDEMRCLALVAHNHMKPAMKEFVLTHKEILRKFRLTGTNTTITMLQDAFGDDPDVQFGPAFSSGPLGGDAELCALMCLEDLGGIFFFMDPLTAHPHQADIDSLVRLANVHNILTCINPCTAHAMSFLLKCALQQGRKDKIPSFFYSLKSPGVAVYKAEQQKALEQNKTPVLIPQLGENSN